jgi:hypothetical protein
MAHVIAKPVRLLRPSDRRHSVPAAAFGSRGIKLKSGGTRNSVVTNVPLIGAKLISQSPLGQRETE